MKKRKFGSRDRRAYWCGVGLGLMHNKNVSPDELMAAVVGDGLEGANALESLQNGYNRVNDAKSGNDLRPKGRWRSRKT